MNKALLKNLFHEQSIIKKIIHSTNKALLKKLFHEQSIIKKNYSMDKALLKLKLKFNFDTV